MTTTNPSEASYKEPGKKRRFLSAQKKFQIYLEAQSKDQPVGELLRREGLYSTDLVRIRAQVEEGALQRMGAKPGHQQGQVSSVKRAPEYPGQFRDDRQAIDYFNRYFTCYNNEHYLSGIDYVTPDQAHQGLRHEIVYARRIKHLSQRRWRRAENQKQNPGTPKQIHNQQ